MSSKTSKIFTMLSLALSPCIIPGSEWTSETCWQAAVSSQKHWPWISGEPQGDSRQEIALFSHLWESLHFKCPFLWNILFVCVTRQTTAIELVDFCMNKENKSRSGCFIYLILFCFVLFCNLFLLKCYAQATNIYRNSHYRVFYWSSLFCFVLFGGRGRGCQCNRFSRTSGPRILS